MRLKTGDGEFASQIMRAGSEAAGRNTVGCCCQHTIIYTVTVPNRPTLHFLIALSKNRQNV